jgi:hypothetical protein
MIKKLFYTTFLFVISNITLGQTQIGTDINGEAEFDLLGYGVSLSSDGSVVAIGAGSNDGNGIDSGHVRVYKNMSGVWTKQGADINGESEFDYSGHSVSLSDDGSIVAIGAYGNDGNGSDSGQVRVYKNISGIWTQQGADINGENSGDQSGFSVSLSSDGSIVAIGACRNAGNGPDSGQVRVYKNVSGIWTQQGTDINGEISSQSGISVSLSSDGSIVAVGAYFSDGNGENSGQVRVYKNVSGIWTQQGADINGETAFDLSGVSVCLSSDGGIVAIGAYTNNGNGDHSGQVRVYKNISGVWTQQGGDIDGESTGDQSGIAVTLSSDGSIVAIGAITNDGNGYESGQVRVYKNVSGVWTQRGADIDGESAGDQLGWGVSLSSDGSKLAIGAPRNNGNGSLSGHVRMYSLSAILSSDSFVLENFKVFPNPTSEQVTITLQENLQLEKVNIYNTLGQLIKTENKSIINVSSLSKGSYYFEVITNQGKATKTIVIQ